MATSIPLRTIHNPLLTKPSPLRKPHHLSQRPAFTSFAKFNLSEILGGRGLCNGEKGIQKELERTIEQSPQPQPISSPPSPPPASPSTFDGAFEKELLGLTGGFPGGEKGLKKFIEENPPPPKKSSSEGDEVGIVLQGSKPQAPELPLLMPGMIVIVKNPRNPYHMYCGIVQRITDGRAAVLFEGGNWDRLISFNLDELERREKGPPMVNPKSCILESTVEKSA